MPAVSLEDGRTTERAPLAWSRAFAFAMVAMLIGAVGHMGDGFDASALPGLGLTGLLALLLARAMAGRTLGAIDIACVSASVQLFAHVVLASMASASTTGHHAHHQASSAASTASPDLTMLAMHATAFLVGVAVLLGIERVVARSLRQVAYRLIELLDRSRTVVTSTRALPELRPHDTDHALVSRAARRCRTLRGPPVRLA